MRSALIALIALIALALAIAACSSFGQTDDAAWLASPKAAEFRERVVQLALIYGESSGIDLRGFKVQARETGALVDGCADVEVVTLKSDDVVRRETVRACKAH
jgi:hypothetical protein